MSSPKTGRPGWMKFEVTVPDWVQPAIWGAVIGAGAWWIILANAVGWLSPDAAAQQSAKAAREAAVAISTPACVARFTRQPNAVAVWHSLKKIKEEWNWADFIRKDGGLVGERGQQISSETADAIASSCATAVLKLTEIGGVKLT